jgi:hypothetical protein
MRFDLTRQQVNAVLSMVADYDDDQLRVDMLEGQTNLYEFVGKLLVQIEEDEGIVNALAEQIDVRKGRQEAAKARIASRREMIMALMDIARVDKLVLPEATVSKRIAAPKAIVTDELAVPDAYCTFRRAPNIMQIRADFDATNPIPGVSFDNGGQSITVRRK